MNARIISEKIRGGETAPQNPIWNNKPFARDGLIARLRGMSGNSRKLVAEAIELQQEGQLKPALAKFQLAITEDMNWHFALKLRERCAHLMHEIAYQKLRPESRDQALEMAAGEYLSAAEFAQAHFPREAVPLYICARDLYTEIGDVKKAEGAHRKALGVNPQNK